MPSPSTDAPPAQDCFDASRGRSERRTALVRGVLGVAAASLLIALTGCSSSARQPTSYGDVTTDGSGYFGNFMYGCTGVQPKNGKYENPKLSSADFCKCVFEGLKATVPFGEVRDFEQAQADAKDGKAPVVPKGIDKVRRDCAKKHPHEPA